jgi:hypothetical protein
MLTLCQKLQKSLPDKTTKILTQIYTKTISCHRDSFKISPTHNSVGLINCLLQPGLFYLSIQKSMREEFNPLIKYCATRTDPAAETKSIGLQADTLLSWFLQFHLDYFIVTRQILPTYRDNVIWTVLS